MISRLVFLIFIIQVGFINAQLTSELIGTLPDEVLESSGLIFYNGKLITHNDSGNSTKLYEIDPLNLQILRIIDVTDAINTDWEDLAQDDDYIYIGDFGNNTGNREDLSIYRISKSDYDVSNVLSAERIDFSYEDQTDFSGTQNSDWDAEALVDFGDQLLIFTKQWVTNGTVAYAIPKTPGEYTAKNLGFYDVNGLISGAVHNKFSNVLMLLGYSSQLQPFILRIDELSSDFTFNGTETKSSLGIAFSQVEGITFSDANTYFISSERFQFPNPPITLNAEIFTFKTNDEPLGSENTEEDPAPIDTINPEKKKDELIIYKQFGSYQLQYDLNSDAPIFGRAIFDITGKRVRHTHGERIENNTIDLAGLDSNVYYLTFYLQGSTIAKPFILD